MNIEPLIAELRNDPLSRGYAAMTVDEAVASLNAVDRDITRSTIITRLTLNRFGLVRANAIWLALQAANDQVAYSLENGGLDVNDSDVQATLGALAAAEVMTADEEAELVALANATVSRADECNIGEVNWQDVTFARARIAEEAN